MKNTDIENLNQEFFNLKLKFVENSHEIERITNTVEGLERQTKQIKDETEKEIKENIDLVIKELQLLCDKIDQIELNSVQAGYFNFNFK